MRLMSVLMLLTFILCGCTSYKQYGDVVGDNSNQARVFRIGHINKLPINVMLKLKGIDENELSGANIIGYDMAPKEYELKYIFIFITDGGFGFCGVGFFCKTDYVNWLKYPYTIRANLKPGYVYMPILKSETEFQEEICLYGEPLGAPGQNINEFSLLATLSNNAEKIACGTIDKTTVYESYE